MEPTYYFYDLETSGLQPRTDRIMQFAGMRTDMDFNPIGEPTNLLIELAEDTLPSPWAIMVTGITPNSTRMDGISEREFCRFLIEEVATPGTTIMGYNSVRFDDEFIRHTLWRNFYDPYEWQWKEGRSKWDLLDVVRLTRALRPEGINWPVTADGKATNRLELITKENKIEHKHAHDALSDVEALISVTKLIREHQPQLFDYLYKMRDRKQVARLVNLENPRPFVYASGRYGSEYNFTTVAYPIGEDENRNLIVFDLRNNLEELLANETEDPEMSYFPAVKTLQLNHCPAVAPVSVLDKEGGWSKIELSRKRASENLATLRRHPEFIQRMTERKKPAYPPCSEPEEALYDGFLGDHDRLLCSAVRNNGEDDLKNFCPDFQDKRLIGMLGHYKARNFPGALSDEEREDWEKYRIERLERQAPKFFAAMNELQQKLNTGESINGRSRDECEFLLQELMLWYENLR